MCVIWNGRSKYYYQIMYTTIRISINNTWTVNSINIIYRKVISYIYNKKQQVGDIFDNWKIEGIFATTLEKKYIVYSYNNRSQQKKTHYGDYVTLKCVSQNVFDILMACLIIYTNIMKYKSNNGSLHISYKFMLFGENILYVFCNFPLEHIIP